tara:strand:+ start:651 stop:1814 length:1164 start_codon:yes stop_codon:yes gene_type:complete
MIRKVIILALVVCLALAVLSPGLVQAQGGLTVLDSSAQVEFPMGLNFSLSARSDVSITDIRLLYEVDRMSYARVTSEAYLEFVPGTVVDVSWTLEMVRVGGLPPGSGIDYWWAVKDAAGNEVKTAPVRVDFDDERYSWQSLTEGEVTIYWYEGEPSFAQEIMTTAQQALTRLTGDAGAHLEKPVKMYIYTDPSDLQGAMIFPQEWTGGVAFTRFGIIAIGISPDNLDWGKKAIAHELTHLVVHQMTLNPYGEIPAWLDEGLAMYTEGPLLPGYVTYLDRAIAENSLISVRSLSSPFSAYADEAALSYTQSYSLVEFLISSYGQGKMLELLNIFKQGSTYDGALEQVYGFNMVGLDALWREYIVAPARPVDSVGLPPVLVGMEVSPTF